MLTSTSATSPQSSSIGCSVPATVGTGGTCFYRTPSDPDPNPGDQNGPHGPTSATVVTTTMTEVPIRHPSLHRPPPASGRRYAVDDVSLTLLPASSGAEVDPDEGFDFDDEDEERLEVRLKGMASASVVDLPVPSARSSHGGPTVMASVPVLTSGLPERPNVLSLSVGDSDSGTAEIDLSKCSRFAGGVGGGGSIGRGVVGRAGIVVRTECFPEDPVDATTSADDDGNDDHIGGGVLGAPVIRINMTDDECNVLSIRFLVLHLDEDMDQLTPSPHPTSPVRFHPVGGWLKSAADDGRLAPPNPGSRLSSRELVAYPSPTTIVVALPPLLACADLDTGEVVPWVDSTGVYDPNRTGRRSGVLGIAKNLVFGMFAGQGEENDDDDDDWTDGDLDDDWGDDENAGGGGGRRGAGRDVPASTAAVCAVRQVCSTGEEGDEVMEVALVFSLHSDGTLRKWTLPVHFPRPGSSSSTTVGGDAAGRRSILPMAVHRLRIIDSSSLSDGEGGYFLSLPRVNLWSPRHDAVSLCSTISEDGTRYRLAVAVRTSLPVVLDDAPEGVRPATAFLALLGGGTGGFHHHLPESGKKSTEVVSGSYLDVPDDVVGTAGVAFCRGGDGEVGSDGGGRGLHCLFYSSGGGSGGGRGRAYSNGGVPPPTNVKRAVITRYPIPSWTADGASPEPGPQVAILTLDRTADSSSASDLSSDYSVDAVVRSTSGEEEIDATYLRTIFRPPRSARSVGGTKPSDRTVRRALRRCCPHYDGGAMTMMIGRGGGSTSGRGSIEAETLRAVREWRRQDEALATLASGGPGAGGLLIAANEGGDGGVAAMEVEGEGGGEGGETIVADTSSPSSSLTKTSEDRRRVHCRRWQSLIGAIRHEEALLRRPLVIGSTSSPSSPTGGGGVGGSSSASADGDAAPSSLVVRCGVSSLVVVACSETSGGSSLSARARAKAKVRSSLDGAALSLLPGDAFSSSPGMYSSTASVASSSSPPPTPPRAGGLLRRQSSGQRAAAEERIRMYRRSLCALERRVEDVASSGQLALTGCDTADGLRKELEDVGLMAVQALHAAHSVSSGGGGSPPEDVLRGAAEALDALSSDPRELLSWSGDVATELRLPPDGFSTAAASAAGTSTGLDARVGGTTTTTTATSTTATTSDERIETSSYLFGLYAESHRRLALGRCLLLSGLRGAGHAPPPFSVEAERTALRTLLVCTAAMCVSAQPAAGVSGGRNGATASGRAAALTGRVSTSATTVTPGRFSDRHSGVRAVRSSSSRSRTVLEDQIEGQMRQITGPRGGRRMDLLASSTGLSLLSSRRVLARCVIDVSRCPDVPPVDGAGDDDREGHHIPRYLDQLDPRLVLKLLAPYVAIPLSTAVLPSSSGAGAGASSVETDRDGLYRIRTLAATCMLREAAFGVKFSTLSDEQARELRVAACGVYRSAVPSSSSSSSSPDGGGDVDDVAATERDRWGMSVVYNVLRGGRDHSAHGAADDGRGPPRDDDDGADAARRDTTVLDDGTSALLMRGALLLPKSGGGVVDSSSSTAATAGEVAAATDGGRAVARLPSCRSLVSDWIASNSFYRPATGGGSAEAYVDALLQELSRQVGDMCDIYDTNDGDDHASGGIPGEAPPPPPEELVGTFFRSMRIAAHRIDLLDLSERLTADEELMLQCALGASAYLSGESNLPEDMVRSYMGETATLCSSSFRHAARIQRWDVAFASCRANPVAGRRRDDFRRLVVTMAECGALGEVLRLPYRVIPVPSVDGGDDVDDSPVDTVDLYEAAVASLQEKVMEQREQIRNGASVAGEGSFSSSSPTGGNRCFFVGCLYALYVSRGDWRRAAQVMDGWNEESAALWTKHAADGSSLGGGDRDMTEESLPASLLTRRRRCGNDMALAALACSICVDLIEKESLRYVITGEHGEITAITAEAFGVSDVAGTGERDRLSRVKTPTDLSSRALLSLAWNEIMETSSPSEMKSLPSVDEAIDLLASLGYYGRATMLATTLNADENGGPAKFVRALCNILCVHLCPAAVRLSRPTPINVEGSSNDWEKANLASLDRPTTSQLHAMSASDISCFDGDRRSSAPGHQISDGKAAMGILQLLVQRYANSGNRIAVEVAAALLDLDGGRAALPLWITNLLTGTGQGSDRGSENVPTNRGLFASTSSNRGSAGNPVALLKLYMDRGMYVESCRLVTSVLVGSDGGEGRRARSSQRLPEKGDIDFVPYSYIDVLWKLTESATASGSGFTVSSKKKILEARDEMEGALRFHFEMIALSEVGLQSARVLAKGS